MVCGSASCMSLFLLVARWSWSTYHGTAIMCVGVEACGRRMLCFAGAQPCSRPRLSYSDAKLACLGIAPNGDVRCIHAFRSTTHLGTGPVPIPCSVVGTRKWQWRPAIWFMWFTARFSFNGTLCLCVDDGLGWFVGGTDELGAYKARIWSH